MKEVKLEDVAKVFGREPVWLAYAMGKAGIELSPGGALDGDALLTQWLSIKNTAIMPSTCTRKYKKRGDACGLDLTLRGKALHESVRKRLLPTLSQLGFKSPDDLAQGRFSATRAGGNKEVVFQVGCLTCAGQGGGAYGMGRGVGHGKHPADWYVLENRAKQGVPGELLAIPQDVAVSHHKKGRVAAYISLEEALKYQLDDQLKAIRESAM
jgi:hypothetical protein